jgi:hypothetical protein
MKTLETLTTKLSLASSLVSETLAGERRNVARVQGKAGLVSAEESDTFIGEMVQSMGFELLEALKTEPGYVNHPEIVAARREERRLAAERAEREQSQGLTTEINTNAEHVNIRDTLENCAAILARHPFGYKDNWTDDENNEAAEGMAVATGVKVTEPDMELVEA